MLHYLRHIRQKLIIQENVQKYLLYAIGEILLVVIGILIALQVNNWNEERKLEEEAIQVLTDLEQSLERTIRVNPGFYLMPMIQLDSVHYEIFNRTLQADLLDDSQSLNPRDFLVHPMNLGFTNGLGSLHNENVNTVLENERLFPDRFSRLLFMVRRLNAAYQTMISYSSELEAIQDEHLKYMSDKEWMYKTDEESFRKRISFYHTDTYFRNRLRHFNELNASFTLQYDSWTKYSLLTWLEYQILISEKSFMELIEPLEGMGYVRSAEMECTDEINKDPVHSFITWTFVYNNTPEPVDVYRMDEFFGKPRLYVTVQPFDISPAFANSDFRYLQIRNNDTCKRQYAAGWTNFIVVDS